MTDAVFRPNITVFYATNLRFERVKTRSNFEGKDFNFIAYQQKPCYVEIPLNMYAKILKNFSRGTHIK